MHLRIPRPLPKRLPLIPKQNPKQTPQNNQAHIRHNWRDISTLNNPRRNEFTKAIAPDILIDRDSDEDGARDRFVGIDRVGGRDGGEGCDLDACAGVANYDDDLVGVGVSN